MKKYRIAAAITTIGSIALYPLTNYLAALERGYSGAFGGEELLLAVGLWAAVGLAVAGRRKASGEAVQESKFEVERIAK